jgi:hypothetical protein
VEDLDLVSDRDHARALLKGLADEPRRETLAIPTLAHLEDDASDRAGQTDALREPPSRLAIGADDVVEEPFSCSDPLEYTASGAAELLPPDLLSHRPESLANSRGVRAHVRRDPLELVRPDQASALVGERGASDRVDQRGVKRVAPHLLVETELLGEPRGDECRPQGLLLREAAAEVGRKRDRRKELREAELLRRAHKPHSLTPRASHRQDRWRPGKESASRGLDASSSPFGPRGPSSSASSTCVRHFLCFSRVSSVDRHRSEATERLGLNASAAAGKFALPDPWTRIVSAGIRAGLRGITLGLRWRPGRTRS